MHSQSSDSSCSNSKCNCHDTTFNRRQFMQFAGTGAAALATMDPLNAIAGPFDESDSHNLIPLDKKLTQRWVQSLYDRGQAEVYTGQQLKYIGMPIGGIACGQLYLGGDGRLWRWDMFKTKYQSVYGAMSMGTHYAKPPKSEDAQEHPLQHGFALRVQHKNQSIIRSLDRHGFTDITFRGEYPIGKVQYRDKQLPVDVDLEAFSPFIPLNAKESALPCTILNYTLRNTSSASVDVELAGWLENAICPDKKNGSYVRRITKDAVGFQCSANQVKSKPTEQTQREDIVFSTFEGDDYGPWKSEGKAFGDGPFKKNQLPAFHHLKNVKGNGFVNTHDVRQVGNNAGSADQLIGTLTSPCFKINRRFITFRIAGGKHKGQTEIRLLIEKDGTTKTVHTQVGKNDAVMRIEQFDVQQYQGQQAKLQIVDSATGPWGHICVDQIVFTDQPPSQKAIELDQMFGYGTMALRSTDQGDITTINLKSGPTKASDVFNASDQAASQKNQPIAETSFGQRPLAAVIEKVKLKPGESKTLTFVLSWHFPHFPQVRGEMSAVTDLSNLKRHYVKEFDDATAVGNYVVKHMDRLAGTTRKWVSTWYDSTLPYWLLDRVMIAVDCLATTTMYWFDSGRIWAWEGTDCCPGTCQHVWNYAQAMARLFPEFEQTLREKTDYGLAWHDNGAIDYRGESARHVAADGQLGTIMRVYREHTMQSDDAFLKRLWPRVRQSIQFMVKQDGDEDGLLEGAQYNTLDQAWYGPMGWISSMYLGALAAGRAMAMDMGDDRFANQCNKIIKRGRKNIVDQLFNDEYFYHKPPDYKHTNTNIGCHIDQVLGQSWCWLMGLDRIIPQKQTRSALQSIWKYNFTPDAGGYRQKMQKMIKGGRWYAMPGEAGVLMTTWPKGGAEKASGGSKAFAVGVGYFNECMNGFEFQAASHMIWEGQVGSDLVKKGLAITKAVHERYAADKRNPYNEIECSDHYSRSMASYGVFQALCGFDYHGPKGHLGFAPRISPENFKTPFTVAQGWGTFSQQRSKVKMTASITMKYGKLMLNQLTLNTGKLNAKSVTVEVDGQNVSVKLRATETVAVIEFTKPVTVDTDQLLSVSLS